MLYAIANVNMKPSRVIVDVSYYDLRVGVVIALDVVYVKFTFGVVVWIFPCRDLGGFLFPLLLDSLMLSFVLAACPYRHDLLWSSQTCTALPGALHLFRRWRLSVGTQLERCVRWAGLYRRQSGVVSCPQCEIHVSIDWLYGVWQYPRVKRGFILVSTQTGLWLVHIRFLSFEWIVQLLSWF